MENPSNQMIVMTGTAAQEDYANVLSEVMYENTAEEPGDMTLRVVFTIEDNSGFINTATTTINVISTNDRAIITLADPPRVLTFDEQRRVPIQLFNGNDSITDTDGNTLQWLTITLSPSVDINDTLNASVAMDTGLEVHMSEDLMSLNISGTASLSMYQTALQSVNFTNTFPGLTPGIRNIEVVAFDGETPSVVQTISVNVSDFDDPPMCFFNQLVTKSLSHTML